MLLFNNIKAHRWCERGEGELKRALLVIDVQNEYITGRLPVTHPLGSLQEIIKVIEAARSKEIPVVFIQHAALQKDAKAFQKGSEEWKLHPGIAEIPCELLVEKNLPGSFTGTDLESWLREMDINTVVIAGYMTQMCCDTTARQAFHLGFSVEFLSDATGTLQITNEAGTVAPEELHSAILVTQAARFSKVLTAEQWIDSLA